MRTNRRLSRWAVVLTVALACPATVVAEVVTAPFSDDFNDETVGPWVETGGTHTHTGTVVNHVATGGINGATVEVTNLGGANTTDFFVSVEIDPTTTRSYSGFGLLSTDSNLAAGNNQYYLVDISANDLRFVQIDLTAGGGIRLPEGLNTIPYTRSPDEIYTLTVEGMYSEEGLTIAARLTSVGGDNDDVTLTILDSTPLTGQHFGMETFGGGERNFDNFSISFLGPPSVTGDIDQNGVVDRADVALFTSHFGIASGSTFTTGDFNADERTSLADLALLQANLGNTSPQSPVAVPEPSSIILVLVALALGGSRSRRALRRN